MRRFLLLLIITTVLGLWSVHGKMETVKIGYDIRQLNIRKLELTHRLKEAELEIARRTAPEELKNRLGELDENWVNPELKKIARAGDEDLAAEWGNSDEPTLLARLFLNSARAETASSR